MKTDRTDTAQPEQFSHFDQAIAQMEQQVVQWEAKHAEAKTAFETAPDDIDFVAKAQLAEKMVRLGDSIRFLKDLINENKACRNAIFERLNQGL